MQKSSITVIKNHIDKIEKSNFNFKEITKPFKVKEIKTLTPRKLNNLTIYRENSLKNIADFNKCMHNGTFSESFKIYFSKVNFCKVTFFYSLMKKP